MSCSANSSHATRTTDLQQTNPYTINGSTKNLYQHGSTYSLLLSSPCIYPSDTGNLSAFTSLARYQIHPNRQITQDDAPSMMPVAAQQHTTSSNSSNRWGECRFGTRCMDEHPINTTATINAKSIEGLTVVFQPTVGAPSCRCFRDEAREAQSTFVNIPFLFSLPDLVSNPWVLCHRVQNIDDPTRSE
jgi:hypothetical protein